MFTITVKIIIGGLIIWSALAQILSQQTWWFIQNVNLIFHEAGHVIFIFFGNFLYTLGGSLVEISIPLLVTLQFARTKQFFSAACASWWLATAFLSVSIYASDARERALPLITNDITTHDWFNLLLQLDILKYDDLVGYVFLLFSIGSGALIVFFISKDKDVRKLLNSYRLR